MHIAVIGAGISGLMSAYLLRHAHRVELFDARATAGGHANTVLTTDERGEELPLDVGFIVYTERTYPVFSRLLRELGIASQVSDMSFGVRDDHADFEFSSRGVRGYLAQSRNLLRPWAVRIGLDTLRFQREAREVLRADTMHEVGFDAFLRSHGYSAAFRERVIIPLIASTWSNAPADVLDFPVNYLFRFLEQHGVLTRNSIPEWRWIVGGARRYVEAVLRTLPSEDVHLGCAVEAVTRTEAGVTLRVGGALRDFDAVVIACHADQALALLDDPSDEECTALGAIRYAPNLTVLHTDSSLLPRRQWAQAAWNYHYAGKPGADPELTMTYDLNRLQGLANDHRYCVSVNPRGRVAWSRVIAEFDYAHPTFSLDTLRGQEGVEAIQGVRNTYFAGAYLGYGFHEDGARSGLRIAERLGIRW